MNQPPQRVASLWRDESRPAFRKWTWTITTTSGTILTAVIATVLTFTASRSWKIIRFLLHQSRRHDVPRGAMIREQEVALRAAETDLGTFWQMVSILHSWKRFGRLLSREVLNTLVRSSRRSTKFVLALAFLHFVVWVYLAVQVPEFLLSRNPLVLMYSNSCALWTWQPKNPDSPAVKMDETRWDTLQRSAAVQYYKNCYGNGGLTNPGECSHLAQPALPWTETSGQCPFDNSICLGSSTGGITLETGELSPSHFGINTPVQSVLTINRRITCAPLEWKHFVYMPVAQDPETVRFNFTNGTYRSDIDAYFEKFSGIGQRELRDTAYRVTAVFSHTWDGVSLSPLLRRADGEVSLFVIRKDKVVFWEPMSDPIFGADKPLRPPHSSVQFYGAEEPFGLMGCLEQFRFHDKSSGVHTVWAVKEKALPPLLLGTRDSAIFPASLFLFMVMLESDLSFFPGTMRSTQRLQSSEFASQYGYNLPIAKDHWKTEVRRWFHIGLARAQIVSLVFALGSTYGVNSSLINVLDRGEGAGAYRDFFCNSMMVHSSAHVSIDISTLALCIFFTCLIWILSFCEGAMGRILFRKHPHAVLAWYLDHPTQLLWQLRRHLHATPSGQNAFGLAFGTLGVPVLRQVQGSDLEPRFEIVPPARVGELNALVQSLSEQEVQNIVGTGLTYRSQMFYCSLAPPITRTWISLKRSFSKHGASVAAAVQRRWRQTEANEEAIQLTEDLSFIVNSGDDEEAVW